jgi:hypothetical protein
MTGELVQGSLTNELVRSSQRVFRLASDGEKTALYSMDAADIRPGMQGDFAVVNGQMVYVFADHEVDLNREILCAAGGVPVDEVHWLPDGELNVADLTCLTPLALHRRLQRLATEFTTEDAIEKAWGLKRCAESVLENRVKMEDESPWQKGLVLEAVHSTWDFLCKVVGDEGESFWGWALEHTRSRQDEVGDDSRRKVMSGWMNAVRTYLMNEYSIGWIDRYTWDDFFAVPISKCIRASGTVRRRMMTPRQVAALFDSNVRVNTLRHILGHGNLSTKEEERIEADPVVAEMEPEAVSVAVQEAAVELVHEQWEQVERNPVQANNYGPVREYDAQRGIFFFWKDGVRVTALVVGPNRDDADVQEWLEEIIASTKVKVSKFVDGDGP